MYIDRLKQNKIKMKFQYFKDSIHWECSILMKLCIDVVYVYGKQAF